MKVSDLLDHCEKNEWRSNRAQASLRSTLKTLHNHAGEYEVEDLDYRALCQIKDALEAERRGKRPAAATVKRELSQLGAALVVACKLGVIKAAPPMPSIAVQNTKDRVASAAEMQRIYGRIAERDGDRWWQFGEMVRFVYDTACRRSEALMMRSDWLVEDASGDLLIAWPQFRDATAAERARTGQSKVALLKNGKAKTLPASAHFKTVRDRLEALSEDGRLFPFSETRAWEMWNEVCEDGLTLHTLRHTRITNLIRSGAPLAAVSKLAGHSSIKITADRYGHLCVEDLKGIVA
ncbi:tyrosine-type recombinase/integrase [Brevundimonas sp. BH3]|uniref:tyrosine-type recombinase/integrase n=1 Tax=Brevundimonas sp. BH3 TaxID=3133089 RepID=UPI003255690E